uniref:Uncharacterized protein MANES_10G077600 n=1 Tax=Rhizophora mucronata TaxID=61149 RepID=A0A2P2MB23_RHIMU
MPSFPQPGWVTICEINRDLITAERLSDDRADITYGKILGMVFSPVPFQPEQLVATSAEQEMEQQGRIDGESVQRKGLAKALQGIVNSSIKRFLNPNYVSRYYFFPFSFQHLF